MKATAVAESCYSTSAVCSSAIFSLAWPDLSENLIQHTGAVKALYPTLLTSAVRADFGIDDLPAGRYLGGAD